MSHFDDAHDLINHSRDALGKIRAEYNKSLTETTIKASLLIQIKNFMENLRSALDFSAHGLFDNYGSSNRTTTNIYFPYANLGQSLDEFRRNNRIERCIPGLSSSRPDIIITLEGYQHFSIHENRWLPLFMELNNENKHQKLTPQTRKEKKQLEISSGGATMSIGEGASISIGGGAKVTIGGTTIHGGQTITANNPARISGPGTQTITIWVSFYFSSNNEPVIPLLEKSLKGTSRIVDELSKI